MAAWRRCCGGIRREGLYSSHLASRRRQRDAGELGPSPPKRAQVPRTPDPRDKQIAEFDRRLLRAEARTDRSERLVELPRMVSELLWVTLPEPESGPKR